VSSEFTSEPRASPRLQSHPPPGRRAQATQTAALTAEDPFEKIGHTRAEVHGWMTSKGVLLDGLPSKQWPLIHREYTTSRGTP